MWDDIIIGKSKLSHQICSAVKVFNISVDNISENQESYWISDCILGFGMKVYKDTVEGETITQLIKDDASESEIQNFLDGLILSKVSVSKLKTKIKNEMEKWYDEGKKAKQEEIKDVLGIRERMW